MKRYGCKWGRPHDLKQIADTPRFKWEVCVVCNRKFRWNKGAKKRVDNVRYLEAHARNYAQPNGRTNQLYKKLYNPEDCVIKI